MISRPTALDRLRKFDEKRPGVPGEHWFAFATGMYFLLRRRRTVMGRLTSAATGVAMIARAVSGRDGALAVMRRARAEGSSREAFVDVAAPWPYDDRVRIAPAAEQSLTH